MRIHTRLWPSEGRGVAELEAWLAELTPTLAALSFAHGGWTAVEEDDEGGLVLGHDLPERDPDALIHELRQVLGLSKALALAEPASWVQVWDDLQMVEGTFGRPLSFFGGVVADEHGGYDEEGETKLAEQVAKSPLPGVDLGFPPGIPADLLDAMDHGPSRDQQEDPAFAAAAVAAVDRCAKLRRSAAATALAVILDGVDDALSRPLIVDGWADHAPAVRARLGPILARDPDAKGARQQALDLLFSVPKGLALDDAARLLEPWLDDPELRATLVAVVDDPDAPPAPGTRVEGAVADLLCRSGEGRRAVARRARRDRDGEPFTWWAVRKLLAHPEPDVIPTVRLYARPGAVVPTWLAEGLAEAGLAAPTAAEVTGLTDEEAQRLGAP